jgi:hypothetical protein
MRSLLAWLLSGVTASACASSPPPEERAPAPGAIATLFEFHSGFWDGLHHQLHDAATARSPSGPSPSTAPAWTEAVAYYHRRFGATGGAGLWSDDDTIAIHRRLSGLDSAPHVVGLDPELSSVLESAAVEARAWWPEQDRANRAWIAAVEPALQRHGDALRSALAQVYQVEWPAGPIRVDVTPFAGPFGAYTVGDPPHIAISSRDRSYAGDASLEMIFHEASHVLIEPVQARIAAAVTRSGRAVPGDLWHALLFYTTGELVQRRLGPAYVPYATRNGLWRGRWQGLDAALRRAWHPYLEGKVDLERAIADLVEETAGR